MEAVSTSRRTKAVNRRLVTTKESVLRPLPVSLPDFSHYQDKRKRSETVWLYIQNQTLQSVNPPSSPPKPTPQILKTEQLKRPMSFFCSSKKLPSL